MQHSGSRSPEPAHGGWGGEESSPSYTIPFVLVDGLTTAIGTSETTIASVSTSFTSGNNFVLAIVQFESTANTIILHGNLKLTRGGTTLTSSKYDLKLASSFPDNQKWYALMDIDTSPGSNPTYDISATADATGISGEAKILVINGVTGSEAESAANVTITTSETTLATLTTSLPGGENIVFAIFETANSGTTARYLNPELLKRGSSSLVGTQFRVYHATRANYAYMQVNLIPYLDGGAPANPTYTATADASGTGLRGRAKIVAFSRGWWYAYYTDGVSTLINNAETTLATLSTSIPSGSDAIVIASEQVDNTAASTNSITNGEDKLQQNNDGGTQTVNEYTLQYPVHGSTYDDGKCFALLNEFSPTPSFPAYEVKARAASVPTYINGEAKILVLAFNSVTPAPEFPYGVFVPLATGFAVIYVARKLKKTNASFRVMSST